MSDEFLDSAKEYCANIDLHNFRQTIDMFDELKHSDEWELSEEELKQHLSRIGNFSAEFAFYNNTN